MQDRDEESGAGHWGPVALDRSTTRRPTAADAIYRQLRDAIDALELAPGAPLQEKLLTERFKVSRTPVREALLRLADIGLVDIFPQSGTFVSRIPTGAIAEAVMIRQALEEVVVQRAAETAERRHVAAIDAVLARQSTLADLDDFGLFHAADESLHDLLAEIAGYPSVTRLLRQVKVQINRARRLTLPVAGRMRQVVDEHQLIRDAIAGHDVSAARQAMKAHLSVVIPDVDRLRVQYPDYFA